MKKKLNEKNDITKCSIFVFEMQFLMFYNKFGWCLESLSCVFVLFNSTAVQKLPRLLLSVNGFGQTLFD